MISIDLVDRFDLLNIRTITNVSSFLLIGSIRSPFEFVGIFNIDSFSFPNLRSTHRVMSIKIESKRLEHKYLIKSNHFQSRFSFNSYDASDRTFKYCLNDSQMC